MESMIVPSVEVLECLVVLFQVLGVVGLCLWRLFPSSRWAGRGRMGFVLAVLGLGIAGALCGRQDSHFALFAGVTMTILLIGMIAGSGSIGLEHTTDKSRAAKARLLA